MKYFSKNNFTLHLGDSLKLLKEFPENSFDMVFADPPYFLSSGSFTCSGGKMVSVKKGNWDMISTLEDKLKFHFSWLEQCQRILKKNGTLWVSGTYHSIFQTGIILNMLNYHILNDIVWFKPNASPNLSCRFFTASHETLIWARKNKIGRHKFNYKLMKEGNWEGDNLKKNKKQMRSVWEIKSTPKSEKNLGKHPTQKPIKLLERIILSSTNEGDLILDPFTGSSTTGIVAYANNRRFVGIDNKKEYLDLSISRINNLMSEKNGEIKIL